MCVFAHRAGDNGVVEASHEGIQATVEQMSQLGIDEGREYPSLSNDVSCVKREIVATEDVELESTDGGVHVCGCVLGVRDHAAEHEHGVLRVNDAQAVVAGFVEEEGLHRPIVGGR